MGRGAARIWASYVFEPVLGPDRVLSSLVWIGPGPCPGLDRLRVSAGFESGPGMPERPRQSQVRSESGLWPIGPILFRLGLVWSGTHSLGVFGALGAVGINVQN